MTRIRSLLAPRSLPNLGLLLCLCASSALAAPQHDRIKELARQADSPDVGVRLSVITELVKTEDPKAAKPLISMLKDSNREVRSRAAVALGTLKAESAVKPLIGLLDDADPYVRAWAGAALIRIGSPAVPELVTALKSSDQYIPALAALALSGIGDDRSESALRAALYARNTKVIFGIHTYFVKMGASGSEAALIETLQQFPNKEMAQEFLASGNPRLADAANEWARKFNQKLTASNSDRAPRWGSGVPQP